MTHNDKEIVDKVINKIISSLIKEASEDHDLRRYELEDSLRIAAYHINRLYYVEKVCEQL